MRIFTNKKTFRKPSRRTLIAAASICGVFTLPTNSINAAPDPANESNQRISQNAWDQQPIEDLTIEARIQSEYLVSDVPWYNDVNVTVKDGVATLKGDVRSLRQKELARRLAASVRGVEQIDNKIKVDRLEDISGSDLADRVNRALLINTVTESFEIKVNANDKGAVTLGGTVDSYAESWLARDVAAGVVGVVKVTNNIEVDYKANRIASEIRQDIVQTLRFDGLIDASDIKVRVKDDTATLSGQVASLAERDMAVAASYVAGVHEVVYDELIVNSDKQRTGISGRLSDADIRGAIETALLIDPDVNRGDVTTLVYNRRAQLTGTVPTLSAKHAAEEAAHNTYGVRRVDNYLRVRPDDQPDDAQIKRSIKQALLNNSTVESYEISTVIDDGEVTLMGQVDSYIEKWEAENAISSIRGVRQIVNLIGVDRTSTWVYYDPYVYPGLRPGTIDRSHFDHEQKPDNEVLEDIQSELYWSPFVDGDDIQVEVDSGVATLTGTVEDYGAVRDATQNAFEGGAMLVNNDLKITDE